MMKNSLKKLSPRGWELVIVLITMLGTAITIYFRTISIEEQKVLFEQRKFAYAEFFEGTAKKWQAHQLRNKETELREEEKGKRVNDKDLADELEKRADQLSEKAKELLSSYDLLWSQARLKIAVLADATVVSSLARYFEIPEFEKRKCNGSYERFTKDVAIYQAIRHESKAEGDVGLKDMTLVMFDCILDK